MKTEQYLRNLKKIHDPSKSAPITYIEGGTGNGKTHDGVFQANHLARLMIKYNIISNNFSVITNIQFLDDKNRSKMPKDVYFATNFEEFFKAWADIREKYTWKRPILFMVDEFQQFVHRYRSTSNETVVLDRLFRNFRKWRLSGLFITQYVGNSVPPILLLPTKHVLFKKRTLVNEYNRLNKYEFNVGNDEISFVLPVKAGRYPKMLPDVSTDTEIVTEFEGSEIDLETILSYGGRLPTGISPWTSKKMYGPTYDTYASADFSMDSYRDVEATQWMPALMKELGRSVPQDETKTIRNFFADFNADEYDNDYELIQDLSQSRRAAVFKDVAERRGVRVTQKEAANAYGLESRNAVSNAKRRMQDEGVLEKYVEAFIGVTGLEECQFPRNNVTGGAGAKA